MNNNFRYRFQDLAKYMEDMKFFKQYGGGDDIEPIIQFKHVIPRWKLILMIIVYIFLYALIIYALYLAYYIIFKGYPRWLVNLFTMSFYKKADMDKVLTENDVFMNAFAFLVNDNVRCKSVYDIYGEIYGGTDLRNKILDLNNFITANYDYPYNEKYKMAFREYFLFFYKIGDRSVTGADNQCNPSMKYYIDTGVNPKEQKKKNPTRNLLNTSNGTKDTYIGINARDDNNNVVRICIHHHNFYSALAAYWKEIGKINDLQTTQNGKKDDNVLIYQIFTRDIKDSVDPSNGKYYVMLKTLKQKILDITQTIVNINLGVNHPSNNILPFLLLPSDDNDIKKIVDDYNKYYSKLANIYEDGENGVKFEQMNEYSWYIFEALYHEKYGNQWGNHSARIGRGSSPQLVAYMNLSSNKRETANARLKMGLSDNFKNFAKKCPIFTHIYMNPQIDGGSKAALYDKVMTAYNKLMNIQCGMGTPGEINAKIYSLDVAGGELKKFINSINVMDLYLNEYGFTLTKNYEKQYLTSVQFLKELVTPMFMELIVNRVFISFKDNLFLTIGGPEFPVPLYKEFTVIYKKIEDLMTKLVKTTWKRLFTKDKIKPPAGPEAGL